VASQKAYQYGVSKAPDEDLYDTSLVFVIALSSCWWRKTVSGILAVNGVCNAHSGPKAVRLHLTLAPLVNGVVYSCAKAEKKEFHQRFQ